MTGRSRRGTVQLDPAVGAPDAVWQQASLAASASGVVSELNLRRFGFWITPPDKYLKLDANPWWAHGAACAWNPGWRTVAQVSMATALSSPGASRFCEAGSAWGSGWGAVPLWWVTPLEGNWRMDERDVALTQSSDHVVSMRPEASSMVDLPAGSEGRVVRVEMPVSVWPNQALGIDACTVAKALVVGSHPLDPSGAEALSGPVTGGLWFADASGTLLDASGSTLPATTCNVATPEVMGASTVTVLPRKTNAWWLGIASVSVSAVVPMDAVAVGAWLKVPGCGSVDCYPANGLWSFQLQSGPSPGVAPSWSLDDDGVFPLNSASPLAWQPSFPRSCEDLRWYQRTAADAFVAAGDFGNPGFQAPQESCFLGAMNNWPVP